MSQESSQVGLAHQMTTDSEDKEIPSMLEIASRANKVLRRLRKHAETCECCKDALEGNRDG